MKYTKFRYSEFYGGIATANASECDLDCLYCFSQSSRGKGRDYSPEEVAKKLINICQKREIEIARITAGEPTLDLDHVIEVVKILNKEGICFFFETNGITLGKNPEYIKELEALAGTLENGLQNIVVVVSLKHIVPPYFAVLTKAEEDECQYPIKAIEELVESDVPVLVAYMTDWYSPPEVELLENWLTKIGLFPEGVLENLESEDPDERYEAESIKNLYLQQEKFIKYPSVPYTKAKIGELINEVEIHDPKKE